MKKNCAKNKIHQNQSKNEINGKQIFVIGGLGPLSSLVHGGLAVHIPHRALRPQAQDAFGLNLPSQLVTGYHWLAFLNQVRKNLSSPQFTTNVEYIIDHI